MAEDAAHPAVSAAGDLHRSPKAYGAEVNRLAGAFWNIIEEWNS